jgi:hypothetical protein
MRWRGFWSFAMGHFFSGLEIDTKSINFFNWSYAGIFEGYHE